MISLLVVVSNSAGLIAQGAMQAGAVEPADLLDDRAPGAGSGGPGLEVFTSQTDTQNDLLCRDSLACAAEITGSCVGRRITRVEVADGVAVVLPLLLEDHVQARQDGLGVLGSPRVLAGRGQVV